MRYYRANQAIMDKASMLYNRFKNAFLLGEGEEVVSAAFLRSLLEEKEKEEAERAERSVERLKREEVLQEVKRRMEQVKERRSSDRGAEEEEDKTQTAVDCP
ncbi:lens epithelium-derived growth factor-like [Plectropomus leopardus]|uniref:lens epithelium-derived growth factor-like n=1 Tax=Plectropomus leopardus TaxID=160734 RepID=UPI001C4CDEFF|nr:lens epithelium-derived growth factor-like [Plectropomus leopardus]